MRTTLVGGANGDLDLLESIDGRSYTLQCRSASRAREAENVCTRVYSLNDRDHTAPRAIPICPPHQNDVETVRDRVKSPASHVSTR